MRKKILALVTALTLVCLSGCGNKATGSENSAGSGSSTDVTDNTDNKISGTVATDGSTSMEEVIGALGEMFQNENQGAVFTYNPAGSSSGIMAVSEEKCDIGLASRKLKDEEKALGLEETVLALDGIAVIANPGNKVSCLSVEQIASIYKGEITNWSEVGGADAEIVVTGREAGSGTRDGFESVTGTEDACRLRQELTSTGDVIATVSSNENAIGYASLASVNDTVSVMAVGGVIPSKDTVSDGTYAIQRPFMMVTKKGRKLSAVAQAFMDYALSDAAKPVIEMAGAVPCK